MPAMTSMVIPGTPDCPDGAPQHHVSANALRRSSIQHIAMQDTDSHKKPSPLSQHQNKTGAVSHSLPPLPPPPAFLSPPSAVPSRTTKTRSDADQITGHPKAVGQRPSAQDIANHEVVFVDPLDPFAPFWWPAMIVPRAEVDTTMVRDPSKMKPDEVIVRYFEDNTFSFLSQDDTVLFRLNEAPYTTHFQARRAFHYNKGGLNAIHYLQRGDLPDGFAWKKWKQSYRHSPLFSAPSDTPPEHIRALTPHSFEHAWTSFCEAHAHACHTVHVHDLYMLFMCVCRRGGLQQMESAIAADSILQDAVDELSRVIIKWTERFSWSTAQLQAFYKTHLQRFEKEVWQGQHLQGLDSDTPKMGAQRLPPGRKRKLDRGHSVPVDGPSRLADPSLSVPLPPQHPVRAVERNKNTIDVSPDSSGVSSDTAATLDGTITPLTSLHLSHPALREGSVSSNTSTLHLMRLQLDADEAKLHSLQDQYRVLQFEMRELNNALARHSGKKAQPRPQRKHGDVEGQRTRSRRGLPKRSSPTAEEEVDEEEEEEVDNEEEIEEEGFSYHDGQDHRHHTIHAILSPKAMRMHALTGASKLQERRGSLPLPSLITRHATADTASPVPYELQVTVPDTPLFDLDQHAMPSTFDWAKFPSAAKTGNSANSTYETLLNYQDLQIPPELLVQAPLTPDANQQKYCVMKNSGPGELTPLPSAYPPASLLPAQQS